MGMHIYLFIALWCYTVFLMFSIQLQQLYNLYPRIFQWASNRMRLSKNIAENQKQIRHLIGQSQETLNAQMCRGFVDSFLAHKQKLEVRQSSVNTRFKAIIIHSTRGHCSRSQMALGEGRVHSGQVASLSLATCIETDNQSHSHSQLRAHLESPINQSTSCCEGTGQATTCSPYHYLNCCYSLMFQDSGTTESYYTIDVLVPTVGNLFAAGTDTTGTTLRWGLLFMARYPQIQGK